MKRQTNAKKSAIKLFGGNMEACAKVRVVSTYHGKKLENCSKKELIECIVNFGGDFERKRWMDKVTIEIFESIFSKI